MTLNVLTVGPPERKPRTVLAWRWTIYTNETQEKMTNNPSFQKQRGALRVFVGRVGMHRAQDSTLALPPASPKVTKVRILQCENPLTKP